MIKPTVGHVVWYHPHPNEPRGEEYQPLAAIVTYVWHDRMVNLAVFDANTLGVYNMTSVALKQEGDDLSVFTPYCEWMPYQKGQAAKHDAEKSNA